MRNRTGMTEWRMALRAALLPGARARYFLLVLLALCIAAYGPAARAQLPSSRSDAAPGKVETPTLLPLSAAERALLPKDGVLRVLTDPDGPPLIFRGANGRAQGLLIDELSAAAMRLGLTLQAQPGASWPDALARFEAGEAPLIMPLTQTPAREKIYAFSEPLVYFEAVVYARREQPAVASVEALGKLRFVQVKGSAETQRFRDRYPAFSLKPRDSQLHAGRRANSKVNNFTTRGK